MSNEFYAVHEPILDRDYCEQPTHLSRYPALILVHHNREIIPAHWHAGLEINYVVNGTGTVSIDSKIERLHPGKLCIVSPYSIHSFVTENDDGRPPLILSISFDGKRLQRIYELADRFLLSPYAASATDEDRHAISERCLAMIDATTQIGAETSLKINALLYEMLYLVYRRFVSGTRKHHITSHSKGTMQPILGFIESHHTEQLTEENAAREFGYSREYFSRLFKENIDINFKEYLTKLRLEDAYQQLMYGNVNKLATIANDTGFPSVRSFTGAFRKHYGLTPLAYRKAHLDI
ncbi:AraC family transcriptional regulator [Bifidobacterium mongoliense]|uniref:AraC family transcriptional regulator n=1 Tax=Bifidobacterium mongoliense TaxID=518643 RepID=UPI0030EB7707